MRQNIFADLFLIIHRPSCIAFYTFCIVSIYLLYEGLVANIITRGYRSFLRTWLQRANPKKSFLKLEHYEIWMWLDKDTHICSKDKSDSYNESSIMMELINQLLWDKYSKEDNWNYDKTYCKHQRSRIWTKYKPPSQKEFL